MGLSVNNMQKVRQALVKMSKGGGNHPLPIGQYVSRNGFTIGGLTRSKGCTMK